MDHKLFRVAPCTCPAKGPANLAPATVSGHRISGIDHQIYAILLLLTKNLMATDSTVRNQGKGLKLHTL
jgi:hypothetical protein